MGRYRPPQKPGSAYVTAAGFAELKSELDRLWRVTRPEVTKALSEAAAEGDRSENAEYIYRKKQLGEIDRRIRYLAKRLDVLVVVDKTPADENRIYFGAWFEVSEAGGTASRYRIVGPDEFDRNPHYISMDSPMARAAMKKNVGDEIQVARPGGVARYEITAVSYRPFEEDT